MNDATQELKPIKVVYKSTPEDGKFEGSIELNKFVKTDKPLLCCKYTDDRTAIACGTSIGTVELFSCKTGRHSATLADSDVLIGENPVTKIAHKRVGHDKTLTCTYASGFVKCWHHKTLKCMYSFREANQVLGLAYHPVSAKFVTLGEDGVIRLYDEVTLKIIRVFDPSQNDKMDGHTSRVFSGIYGFNFRVFRVLFNSRRIIPGIL